MRESQPLGSRIVLVGAGHGHLITLAAWIRNRPSVQLDVVDPGRFAYSGMATGVVAGDYRIEEATLDPAPLVEAAGGRLHRGRVVDVDRARRVVTLDNGEQLPYDILSLNVGSAPALPLPAGLERAFAVKPVSQLHRLGALLDAEPETPLVIVGGGVSAAELAVCAAARVPGRRKVELVFSGDSPAVSLPPAARRKLMRALEQRGVRLQPDGRVTDVDAGSLTLARGVRRSWEVLVVAAGLRAGGLVRSLGLPASDAGLLVNFALHAPSDPRIFAVGDCADIGGLGLPPVGVYGVRAGAVLAGNLCAAAVGSPLATYTPQARYLAILNLGQRDGLAFRGELSYRGKVAWWLKDRIDRRFVDGLEKLANTS